MDFGPECCPSIVFEGGVGGGSCPSYVCFNFLYPGIRNWVSTFFVSAPFDLLELLQGVLGCSGPFCDPKH